MSNKRVLQSNNGLQFLFDPNTQSLTAFKETIDVYDDIQKLENKMEQIEQTIGEYRDIDLENEKDVREKLVYPSIKNNNSENSENNNVVNEEVNLPELEKEVEEIYEKEKNVTKPIKKKIKSSTSRFNIISIVGIVLLVLIITGLLFI